MRRLAVSAAFFLASVIGAHALAYSLVDRLPAPALSALGLQSAQPAVRAAFEALRPSRSYPEAVLGTVQGDLGRTLDGAEVRAEIGDGLLTSGLRLGGALLVIIVAIGAVAFAPRAFLSVLEKLGSLVAFVPPFTAPFVVLGVALLTGAPIEGLGGWVAVAAIAASPAALAAAQTAAITRRNLERAFAVTIRAQGASRLRQRHRLLSNLWVELAPTLEKLALGLVTALLFVEPTLGLGGFGSLTARAISRSDPDLLLAITLTVAIAVNLLRLGSIEVRRLYGIRT